VVTNTITIHVMERNGDILFSSEGMALIFGMPLDTNVFPPAVFKRGKRRVREAFAAIGDEDMWAAMEYWAAKDHNAAVEFDFETPL
jgi:hypothetical protein